MRACVQEGLATTPVRCQIGYTARCTWFSVQELDRMLVREGYAVIQALKARGIYLKAIARQLGVHPKGREPEPEGRQCTGPQGRRRGSKLDPYKRL